MYQKLTVIGVVLIVLCKGMEDGLIGLFFFDVIMTSIQSIREIATVGIELVLKLVSLVVMVAVAVNTPRRD